MLLEVFAENDCEGKLSATATSLTVIFPEDNILRASDIITWSIMAEGLMPEACFMTVEKWRGLRFCMPA